jgi:murein DD-endopeptidase MepM/ murein hydrolase activator NlpD
MAGTSIAAAQVTGVASLVWEANPELNYRQIIEALKSTATDLNIPGEDSETGAGLVNPDAAVEKAKQMTREDYDPEDFLTPDTWGGEGLVTPEERAVADEEIYLSNFSAEVISLNGIGTFAEPTTILAQPVGSVSYGDVLEFDAWILKDGTPLRYQGGEYNKEDARWYRLAGKQQWIPAVYLEGEPGDSTLLEETPEDDPSTGEGSSTVDEPPITDEPSPTENGLEWELYTVQEGDTLSAIAQLRTGNANDYQLIANYPENDIPDPNLIYPGDQIWVPKGGSSSSSDSPSPVYTPTFDTYHLFEGAYDEFPWIGGTIGDPYISSSGFVSQEFENAYLEYNGSGVVYIYEKEAEEIPFAPVPDNEPITSKKDILISTMGDSAANDSGKGTLIRTGGDSGNDSSKGSLIGGGIGSGTYYPQLASKTDDWWDKVSGEGYYFDDNPDNDPDPEQTSADKPPLEVKQIYNHLSKVVLGQESAMNTGYLYDNALPYHHAGIDFEATANTKIYPAVSGTIQLITPYGSLGVFIAVNSDDGKLWIYGHLDQASVKEGQKVNPNNILGTVKNQGGDTHLHIEVHTPPFQYPSGIPSGSDISKNESLMKNLTISPLQAFWEWNY